MARRWRLFHEDLPQESGSVVTLGAADSHHARKVLRLSEGEEVALFDGAGREWAARTIAPEGERVRVRLDREILEPDVESPLEVVLFQGMLRPERMEWVVQKATEVGVARIHPFRSETAEKRSVDPRRLERWRRIAVESCKQCGRRRLPVIEPLDRLPDAAGGDVPSILLQPGPAGRPLAEVCSGAPPASVHLAVGPQSGFTSAELEAHERSGWLSAGLGPRILRADTAGAIAAAIVLHRWADLG